MSVRRVTSVGREAYYYHAIIIMLLLSCYYYHAIIGIGTDTVELTVNTGVNTLVASLN